MTAEKQQELEIRKTHDLYWESYIKGDITALSNLLDDHYSQIGSVEEEVFFSKPDAVKFVYNTINQVLGKLEMRNRQTNYEKIDDAVIVLEQCDLYVIYEGNWTFYSKFRASTLMKKKAGGWKIIHQHSSLPDSKTQEGENIAIAKISEENLLLQQAIKRRTIELENKNRELAIEAALEKVRALTMAMHNSEDVGKCVVKMFSELTALGVDEGTRFGIGILNHDNENNQLWTARKDGEEVNMHIGNIDMTSHPLLKSARKAWKAQVPIHKYVLEGSDLLNYYLMLNQAPDYKIQVPIDRLPKREIQHCFIFEHGFFYAFSPREFQAELIHITKRFSSLFEQTYRRYLDLVKAESQAREAEIELALERVRARTMAMQHSDELTEASEVLDLQVRELGIETWGCAFHIYADDPEGDYEWFSSREGSLPFYKTPRENFFLKFYEKGKAGETFHVEEFLGEDCKVHYDYLMTIPVMGDALRGIVASGASLPESQYDHIAFFKHGFLLFITYKPVPESHAIFQRFAKVFEQTFTRFLDLQKAEAQAKEAKIEAALERVRSRTMAMHHTEELKEVIQVVFEQLVGLKIHVDHAGFILDYKEREDMHIWLADHQQGVPTEISIPYFDSPHWNSYLEAKAKGESFFANLLPFEVKNKFYQDLFELIPELTEEAQQAIFSKPGLAICTVLLDNVGLYIEHYTETPFSAEENAVLMRFGKVFQQTYTRFLDLQKAEAQAREAQIETALERVRSRTMGMQRSDELAEVANVLFTEMNDLVHNLWTCGFVLCEKGREEDEWWLSLEDGFSRGFFLPNINDYAHATLYEGWLEGHSFRTVQLDGDKLQEHYDWLMEIPVAKNIFDDMEAAGMQRPEWQKLHAAYFSKGYLVLITREPCGKEEIFKRFAQVFDQTYTRFLDLQKAEAQAREAQIEAALERIRSRAMAMQHSEELRDVALELRTQMGILGQKDLEVCAIHLYEEHKDHFESWAAMHSPGKEERLIQFKALFPKSGKLIIDEMMDCYASDQNEYVLVNEGEKGKQWFELLREKAPEAFQYLMEATANIPVEQMKAYWAIADFSGGALVMVTYFYPDKDSQDLLRRTANVFALAYKRFADLRMAESSARTSKRQASLDRIRADISSMRNAEDLNRITPLVFNELTALGIPFIRCGVFIVHEEDNDVEIYLSTPEGKSLAVMTLPFSANEMTSKSVEAWKKEEVYIQHWNQTDFTNWGKSMQEQGHVKDLKKYQGTETAPESLHLHFVPFAQGLLYVGSPENLSEEQIDLVKAMAKAFSIAYARYEDFVMLEQAKAKVESAMSELKATQSQLIQQEKLASLGQLTAGIAHEIKNPLNFVNNFSEVSMELIEEAIEEIVLIENNENAKEAAEILADIKTNLSKIHEHGTRANSIVTSMLQHSRGGTGKMEPTDINSLVKEYVNLAFHGMRARKNPINVEIQLDLDSTNPILPIMTEDFSRVILNICNNAFDAMREVERKNNAEGTKSDYKAKLRVRTIVHNDRLNIEIEDNGPGIPDDIKDKILQPFFTTKKGTEGTGLGLSITHDIIKAHGGELRVTSEEGIRTEFMIYLNLNKT